MMSNNSNNNMPNTTNLTKGNPPFEIDGIIKRLLDGNQSLFLLKGNDYSSHLISYIILYYLILFVLSFSYKVKNSQPGKRVNLLETEIAYLCQKSRQIFLSQPVLLELEAPIKICGTLLSFIILRLVNNLYFR